jgi:hypothetical protein
VKERRKKKKQMRREEKMQIKKMKMKVWKKIL